MFRQELAYLFLAIEYYTSLSKPIFQTEDIDARSRAIRYYPIVGGLVGVLSAVFAYVIFAYLKSPSLCILGALMMPVILTGALHEKGFARLCDGMGEGDSKESILTIMKNAHINTYGLLGILFAVLWKFCTLSGIPHTELFSVIIVGQIVSRCCAGLLTTELPMAFGEKQDSVFPAVIGDEFSTRFYIFIIAGVLALVGTHGIHFYHPLMALGFFYLLFKSYIQKTLDGYTEESLAACQQLAEIVFYISCVITFNK